MNARASNTKTLNHGPNQQKNTEGDLVENIATKKKQLIPALIYEGHRWPEKRNMEAKYEIGKINNNKKTKNYTGSTT